MRKIAIYYPSKITGGAEFLLKTTAELLLKNNYKVTVFDVLDGWLSSNIKGADCFLLRDSCRIELDKDTVLLTTANIVRKLSDVFFGNFKVVAWIVHPFNVIPALPKVRGVQYKPFFKFLLKKTVLRNEYSRTDKLVKYLSENKSLYVMDDSCNDVFYSYFNFKIKNYLPVVIPDNKFSLINNFYSRKAEEINCVWLGRLDGEFKSSILIRTLIDTNKYAQKESKSIVFRIIGDGPGYDEILVLSKTLDSIKIQFMLERKGEDLKKILIDSNIGFAMGTSALEIAACYVPTVLLDASYSVVSNVYKYQWLFEVKGYTLGRIIDSSVDKTMGNKKTINDIFSELFNSGFELSVSSYNHVRTNHSESSLNKLLQLAIENTSSDFNHMLENGLTEKPFWQLLRNKYERFNKKI